jgi:hypothetical protein
VLLAALGLAVLGATPRLRSGLDVFVAIAALGCFSAAVVTWRRAKVAPVRDATGVRLASDPAQCAGARRVRFTPAPRSFTADGRLRIADPDGPGGTPRLLDLASDVLRKSADLSRPGAGLEWRDTARRGEPSDWQAELDVPVDWTWALRHARLDEPLGWRHLAASAAGPERDVVLHRDWDGLVSYQDPASPLWLALGWRPGQPWIRPSPEEERRIRARFPPDAGRYDRSQG